MSSVSLADASPMIQAEGKKHRHELRNNKKVSFNESRSFPNSSDESDEDETGAEEEEEDKLDDRLHRLSTDDSTYLKSDKTHRLKKFTSYPYEDNNIGLVSSTDSHTSQDSSSHLPEFNKRPLTDTPVVSSVASPEFKSSSASPSGDDNQNQVVSKHEDLEKSHLLKMKNISHLNLSELNSKHNNSSSSISPLSSRDNVNQQEKPKENIETKKDDKSDKHSHQHTKNDFEMPIHLQKQFEKSNSLEKIKDMLNNTKPKQGKAYTLNIPGQTSSKTSPDGRIAKVDVGSKLVIVMVGLPARGKSYITNKLTRYLNWLQHDCRVFNVGNTRRLDTENNNGPEDRPLPDTNTPNNEMENSEEKSTASPSNHNADFFSPDNYTYTALREKWAMDTLDQLLDYVIDGSGSVGIFDATNSTKNRRLRVLKRIQERTNGELKVLFLESICNDPAIIQSNIKLKLSGPDYKKMDPEVALEDFVARLQNYEKAYETIDEQEEKVPGFQYVKMIDTGKKVVSYNVQGFLASQTIYFLLNFNLCERQIWITRHGESTDNLSGKIGGDAHLTKRGTKFSKALSKFMNFQRQEFRKKQLEAFSTRLELKYNELLKKGSNANEDDNDPETEIPTEPNFYVWTSMLSRAVESGQYFDDSLYSIKEMRMLNELGGGKFEGLTYEEIQNRYPKEFQSRIQNKLTYRYPGVGGESYLDVLTRLRPLIAEIERTVDHLLIISHRVVLRILLAYFLNLDRSSIGELDVPLHTLYCLELRAYGTDYRMYEYDESLDWFVKIEPEHQKNIQEIGVLYKQRKFSVVPTAPPSSSSSTANANVNNNSSTLNSLRRPIESKRHDLRRSLSQNFRPSNTKNNGSNNGQFTSTGNTGFNHSHNHNNNNDNDDDEKSLSSKKLQDLNNLRKP